VSVTILNTNDSTPLPTHLIMGCLSDRKIRLKKDVLRVTTGCSAVIGDAGDAEVKDEEEGDATLLDQKALCRDEVCRSLGELVMTLDCDLDLSRDRAA